MSTGPTPHYWEIAKDHLSNADPMMADVINRYHGEALKTRRDGFYTLARAIVGQQISVKAADSIWARLESSLADVSPEAMLAKTHDDLRSIGLSASKATYLGEIASFFKTHGRKPQWPEDNADLVKQLTSIKGVGVWTAEMFMIFHLAKPDVLPLGDIGLLKAIGMHYLDGEKATKAQAEKIAQPWQPYRSVATWYLWRSLDPVVVEY